MGGVCSGRSNTRVGPPHAGLDRCPGEMLQLAEGNPFTTLAFPDSGRGELSIGCRSKESHPYPRRPSLVQVIVPHDVLPYSLRRALPRDGDGMRVCFPPESQAIARECSYPLTSNQHDTWPEESSGCHVRAGILGTQRGRLTSSAISGAQERGPLPTFRAGCPPRRPFSRREQRQELWIRITMRSLLCIIPVPSL